MSFPTAVLHLRWTDLDPSTHAFDPALVRSLAERLVTDHAARIPADAGAAREELESSIDRALIAALGAWAAGWRWSTSEPGGGGPVRAWCCAAHSLFAADDAGPAPSIDRVVDAVDEWRTLLEELRTLFSELPDAAGATAARDVEHAAARLLPLVVERTDASDAWYGTFAALLGWYLESKGYDPAHVDPIITKTIRGRFASWCAPEASVAAEVCRDLGVRATEPVPVQPPADAIGEWLALRPRAFAAFSIAESHEPVRIDGHRRFVDGPERSRDPERAQRMNEAIDASRAWAKTNAPLDFATLASWQGLVLGAPAIDFRTTDAYAKDGRERYRTEGARAELDECLLGANDRSVPLAVRAARLYLDICFFHPFADGNGRAARVALDALLARDRFGLHAVEPLFVVSRAANDARGAWYLAYLVDYLMGPAQVPL